MKIGDRVGWSWSDGGQDNGEYTVVRAHGNDLVIENEHGKRFHAKKAQCWYLEA